MKKEKVKCNVCGLINTIEDHLDFECANCHNKIKYNHCKSLNIIKRDIEYYHHILTLNIYNQNESLIKETALNILEIDYKDFLGNYYILNTNDKEEFLKGLNSKANNYNNLTKEYIDLIIRYDVIFNNIFPYEKKIKIINEITSLVPKNNYSDYINIKDTINESDLILEKVKQNEYRMPSRPYVKKSLNGIYLISILITIIISIIISLICKFTTETALIYPTIIIIDLVPTFVITIFLNKILKLDIKKIYISIILFIIIFIVLSYLMTIPYHEKNILDSITNHFKHILTAIKDIVDAIGKNSDITGDKK